MILRLSICDLECSRPTQLLAVTTTIIPEISGIKELITLLPNSQSERKCAVSNHLSIFSTWNETFDLVAVDTNIPSTCTAIASTAESTNCVLVLCFRTNLTFVKLNLELRNESASSQ